MKSIFIKIIPYLVVFTVVNIILYKTSGFYTQESEYLERVETVINSQSETIFLGDSHVETIKLLNLSDKIGNLAYGADGVDEMYIKVLTMLKYNKNLKHVFIATEPQIFNNSISPNSTFLSSYLLKVEDTLNVYDKTKLNLITEKVPLFNDNYLKFVLNELYSILKPKETINETIWAERTDAERTEIAKKTGKLDNINIMADGATDETFKTIIALCKSNNIEVIGIRFPVNQHYINQCKKEDSLKVDSFIQSLNLDKHFDYSTRITAPEYFHDEDHLNQKGIKKLSKIILENTNIKLTD